MPTPEEEVSTLSADAAVSTQREDDFDRYPFAKRIAEMVKDRRDAASIVLGLYGKWGAGKTSILNFIKAEVEGSQVVTLLFNPWLFSGEGELLIGFFAHLSEALDSLNLPATQQAQQALTDYRQKAADRLAFSRAQVTEQQAEAIRATASLEGFKHKLSAALRATGKRMLILIDDIDRLDKHEIQAMLRLVKLTADFEYTTYLLAFDDAMVARAVGDRYPEGGAEAGYRFLEKIIQVPLRLPIIQQEVLRTYFRKKLANCLDLLDLALPPEQMERVEDALARSVLARDVTPRDISRYTNTLSVVLPMLRDEANMADLLLVEAIKVFYPDQYKLAASQQYTLTGAGEKGQNKELRKQYDDIYGTEASDLGTALPLFKALFAKIAEIYESRNYIWGWGTSRFRTEEDLYKTKSIASAYYFKRYFSYAVQPGEIPDSSFSFLLAALRANDGGTAAEAAEKMVSRSSDAELIRRLEDTHKEVIPQEAATYCQLLLAISPLFTDEMTHLQFGQSLSKVNGLFLSYLLKVASEDTKLSICEDLIQQGAFKTGYSLLFQIDRLKQWGDEIGAELSTGIAFFTTERFNYLTKILLERALAIAQDKPLYEVFGVLSRHLLELWQKTAGKDATSYYLRGWLAKSPTHLTHFLASMSQLHSSDTESFFGPLGREDYQLIETLVESDYLYALAQKVKTGDSWSPLSRGQWRKPSDEERIQQFIYFHDNPEQNQSTEVEDVED